MVVSAFTNQVWTRITFRNYAWSFGHSDPDSSSLKSAVKIGVWEKVVLNVSINIYSDQKALGPLCSGPTVFAKKLCIPHGH